MEIKKMYLDFDKCKTSIWLIMTENEVDVLLSALELVTLFKLS